MNINLKGLKLAIIGGNSPCKQILETLLSPGLKELDLKVLVVADTLTRVEGIKYAREKGVFTTTDYEEVCKLSGIDVILKLKNDEILSCILDKVNTEHVSIIDLDAYRATSFLNYLKAEEEKIKIKRKIGLDKIDRREIAQLVDQFAAIIRENAEEENRYLKVEREGLIEMEKELSQIIQGSMIPTFIINNEHILTHWNRAVKKIHFPFSPIWGKNSSAS